MIAPVDSFVAVEAGGETFTLRLNFRSIALAEDCGIDLLSGVPLKATKIAVMLRCLAAQDHPDLTDEMAFSLLLSDGETISNSIAQLFEKFAAPKTKGKAGELKAA